MICNIEPAHAGFPSCEVWLLQGLKKLRLSHKCLLRDVEVVTSWPPIGKHQCILLYHFVEFGRYRSSKSQEVAISLCHVA